MASSSRSKSSHKHKSGSRDRKETRKRSQSGSKKRGSRSPERRASPPPYKRRQVDQIPPNRKLFITNIDSKVRDEQLRKELDELFSKFGSIKEITIKTKPGSNNSFAFIQYEELDSAAAAKKDLKGYMFKDRELKVQFGKGERKHEDRKADKCYICHKEGHFAKDCSSNRYDNRSRDRSRSRHRDHHRKKYSRSRSSYSSDRSYRKRKHRDDRDDYKSSRRRSSPEKKSSYNSSRRY